MKKIYISVCLLVSLTLNSIAENKTLKKAKDFFNNNGSISYSMVFNAIMEPYRGDTLIQYTTACFSVDDKNNNILCYSIIDSMLHHNFNAPAKQYAYYDGEQLTEGLESAVYSYQKTIKNPDYYTYANKMHAGHLLLIRGILNQVGYAIRSVKDTTINKRKYTMVNALNGAHIPHTLLFDSKTGMPVYLRLTLESFVYEYTYSNFNTKPVFRKPSIIKDEDMETKQLPMLFYRDTFPDWEFVNVNTGEPFRISDLKSGRTIVFTSMTLCKAWESVIPYINKMYRKYNNDNNINCVVIYPLDRKNKLQEFASEYHPGLPVFYNNDAAQNKSLFDQIQVFPHVFILDKEHRLLWDDGYKDNLDELIEEALKKY